ncbi:MAG: hypothetical protein VW124_10505 [Paracoccaceae bacterium]
MKRIFLITLLAMICGQSSIASNHSVFDDFAKDFEAAVKNVESRNFTEAIKTFDFLANEGLPEAQFNLSLLYYSGLGAPKNFKMALYWCWYAHLNGHQTALKQIEQIYGAITENLRNDVANTIIEELLVEAKEGAQAPSLNLGKTYTNLLVTPDYKEAYVWLSIAQAYGLEEASELLDTTAKQLTLEEILIQQEKAATTFQEINP